MAVLPHHMSFISAYFYHQYLWNICQGYAHINGIYWPRAASLHSISDPCSSDAAAVLVSSSTAVLAWMHRLISWLGWNGARGWLNEREKKRLVRAPRSLGTFSVPTTLILLLKELWGGKIFHNSQMWDDNNSLGVPLLNRVELCLFLGWLAGFSEKKWTQQVILPYFGKCTGLAQKPTCSSRVRGHYHYGSQSLVFLSQWFCLCPPVNRAARKPASKRNVMNRSHALSDSPSKKDCGDLGAVL